MGVVLAHVTGGRTDRFPGWAAEPTAYLLLGLVALAWWLAVRRESDRRGERAVTTRHTTCFVAGLALLWVGSDWPVHELAERYLYSVHMVQHMLFSLMSAPLLLLGTPPWMMRRLLRPPWLLATVRWVCRPVPNLVQFNAILVLSHWPFWVDATLRHHWLHFFAHGILLVSALAMWMTIVSPIEEVPRARPPGQMLYLFIQTILPTVPASFLTFGSAPLYHFYEHVPRLYGWSALSDQQTAGLIMKLVGGFYLYAVIAVIFFRWFAAEERGEAAQRDPDVLLWEDVEAELKRLG